MNQITVDFARSCGKMKIMHAVNNGPIGVRKTRGASNWKAYQEAEIPYARNHDASFSQAYGGEYTVDVHRIFQNFDADVNDPASYDFTVTDLYIADTEAVGTRTFYRLGASIEHGPKKVGTVPPKNFQKWAEICEHIIRHYTEGWADGFHYDIRYWEIWNEPDFAENGANPCWQGTREQFFDLFITTLRHLKGNFPHLKIGGPALCGTWRDDYIDQLFDTVEKAGLKMDFFSFHGYRNEPYLFDEDGEHAWGLLEKHGLEGKVELLLNEWNYIKGWRGDDYEKSHHIIKSLQGASFVLGTMCAGQKSKLDMMMYYDARPSVFNGMFASDFYTPLKGYYPFKMYSKLYKMGTQVASEGDDRSLYHLAAAGEDACGIVLTHYVDDPATPAKKVALRLENCPLPAGSMVKIYLLDETHDMELVREERLSSAQTTLYFDLELFAGYYIEICKE